MASPFDYAWMLLKAKSEYPPAPFYSSTDRGYEDDPNEGAETFSHLPGDEPTPDLEESAAMAPDSEKPPTGQSQEEALEALFAQFPHLRDQFTGGAPDEPV